MNFSWPLLAFMKNSLFHFIALLLYWKRPLSALIKNSLYQGFFTLSKKGLFRFITLLKTAFIEDFSLYCLIKNGLYRPLLKTAFLLYCFIKNGLNWPLSKKGFFALSLYLKQPLLVSIKNGLFCFIALSKTVFINLYQKQPLSRIFG